jgi:hypothetical protein
MARTNQTITPAQYLKSTKKAIDKPTAIKDV